MAPTSGKRSAIRAATSKTKSASSHLNRQTQPKSQNLFASSKKDKRIIRHSALISRIEKSKAQPKKRRRPSRKLVANLDSLAAALPLAPPKVDQEAETGIVRIRHRSLKTKPGAMKKKEKIISQEKDRFNKNMAQMATVRPSSNAEPDASNGTDSQSAAKWAALRNFVQQTMEQRPLN
ncbi:MAG: hypothetical protein L6R40_004712 [Gallowayella cf. fulva]|nr:MAG: hypothetical protein L6R40_004712 [Xanthomendoza cf. fulva]